MNWLSLLVSLFRRPKPPKAKPVPPGPPVRIPPVGNYVAMINETRAKFGVGTVFELFEADQAAKVQTDWQAQRDMIGHDGPPGLPWLSDRLAKCGLPNVAAGEIAAQGSKAYWPDGKLAIDYTFETSCRDWLTSPGHKAILLDPSWTHAGAEMATATSGKIYSTAVFVRLP